MSTQGDEANRGGVMQRLSTPRVVKIVVVLAVVVAAALTTKRVSLTDDGETTSGGGFTPAGYVDERWESEVRPAVVDNAVDLPTLLDALADDEDAANETYGNTSGAGSAYSFAVTATGVGGAVDGTLLPLAVEGVDADVVIQVGPAVIGTALRDATGLVSFNEFVNQLDYQNVAVEMNNRIKDETLADIDPAELDGATITVTGAFTASPTGIVSIVPVELEVEA